MELELSEMQELYANMPCNFSIIENKDGENNIVLLLENTFIEFPDQNLSQLGLIDMLKK